jgi:cytochrome c556
MVMQHDDPMEIKTETRKVRKLVLEKSRFYFYNSEGQTTMKKMLLTLIALSAATLSFSAAAQFAKPEEALKYRKASFTVMGTHFGRLAAMAQGKVPFDAQAVVANADVVANMAKLPWVAFVEGSDQGDTKAKHEVWSQAPKFKELAEKLQTESVKLAAAAKSGKEDTFKAAFTATAGACKSCHDDFKNK